MKGLILAGGLATRLRPLTLVTNKHLLPIYNKPMIFYPMEAMKQAGIQEVLLTTNEDQLGQFQGLLKQGEDFGVRLTYGVQKNPKGGIADAIALAKDFCAGDDLLVILGDNIFNFNLHESVVEFDKQKKGAKIFGVKVGALANQYGVIEMDASGKVLSVIEKPKEPKSDIAAIGVYMFDNRVFDYITALHPSDRGELEVTDLNNIYLKEGTLSCDTIDWWIDAGTSYDELLKANNETAQMVKEGKL